MGNSDHEYDGVYQSFATRAYYRLEGEHVMMRLRQFEPWHEPFLLMTAKEIITMVNHGYWRKVGDIKFRMFKDGD
ncbi:hypothetical protein [Escherichia coli]|uniref:hypothetical protein n=1 Tax=Escherichia coli TaxID=562 RepID=UPI00182E362E|nr:hypothetical protein [Escherichia coli]EEQ6082397.1 hypothetical protein [Escherichia coli]EFL1942360.1 hypothetical protein [Escherichia coli]EGB2069434.1 hypothetical protein [Escherichia coli]ELF3389643.1 hypothetical protein [Escherichia coli]MCE4318635.1 hypothetical protein [Escherichia coli]